MEIRNPGYAFQKGGCLTITRSFETEEEYRKARGLNFSKLAAYWNEGLYSPDHALIHTEAKSYFEYGKMFESLLQDTVKGTSEFSNRFFVSGVQGNMPDKMVKWIDAGEDLEIKIVHNKDGSRSKTHSTMHAFIDECLEHPGMIPVSVEQMEMLNMHISRMCDIIFMGQKCGDLLAKGEWQVGISWESDEDGLLKKGLIDCLVDLGGFLLPIDIKTTTAFSKFKWMLRDKYVIQDLHYVEGIQQLFGESYQMVFFVASKEKPYLCQPWTIDYGPDLELKQSAYKEYIELCSQYAQWNKQPRGWLPMQTMSLNRAMRNI
jgi:hypothetical protein